MLQPCTCLANSLLVKRRGRSRGALMALMVLSCCSTNVPAADTTSVKHFEIKSEPLADALMEFGLQAGLVVVAPSSLSSGRVSAPLHGDMPAIDALRQLLKDSELTFRLAADGAITIERIPAQVHSHDLASEGAVLDEVVVTATKQAEPISKVPVSIVALTRNEMDQESIRTFEDVTRTVPGLSVQADATADRAPSIEIRGISSTTGAQTTGVYLDDVPLQKRAGPSGSGTPVPELFDLDRVEVLRGPQGTLFGGSSLGGAIRFVTASPSVTDYSSYARAEVADTEHGAVTYDVGAAGGGPIVPDVVGFRVSAWSREDGGYIDHVDRFNGDRLAKDTNYTDHYAARAALLVKPTPTMTVSAEYYYSENHQADNDTAWQSVPQTTLAGYTYPAANFGRYQSGYNCNVGDDYAATITPCVSKQPRTVSLSIPSIRVTDDLGFANFISITSYISDNTHGSADYSYVEPGLFSGFLFVNNLPLYRSIPQYKNTRYGETQEFRLMSKGNDALSWTVGAFYSHFANNAHVVYTSNLDQLAEALFGAPSAVIFGAAELPGDVEYFRDQHLTEQSAALFTDLGYRIIDPLKIFAGVRVSHETYSYYQVAAGPVGGFDTPTYANGGLTNGSVSANPVTPRAGVQLDFTPRAMAYVSATNGYRVGGVNQEVPLVSCASDLATLGLTSTPTTYKPDTVWSYEVGAKAHGDNFSVAASGYYIDWKNVQTEYTLPTCGFGYTINAGRAVSKGFDLDAVYRPTADLTLREKIAYVDAEYTEPVTGSTGTIFVGRGQELPTPPWSLNIGADYEAPIKNYRVFGHIDYQYSSPYQRSFGPGSDTYAPDSYIASETRFATARIGLRMPTWEVSLYVYNLFDSIDALNKNGGRQACLPSTGAACTSYGVYQYPVEYSTFRPRTFGLSVLARK
jgi:iron complex outermembrane recepter protein